MVLDPNMSVCMKKRAFSPQCLPIRSHLRACLATMGAVNDCLDLIGISCTAIGLGKGGQMIASHAKVSARRCRSRPHE